MQIMQMLWLWLANSAYSKSEVLPQEIERREIVGPSGKNVEVEVFAHGALCMAVSGKCYLSLHSHNSSANRGACIQNCRREYTVIDKEEGIELDIDNEYIMSAKDLATIDFLDKVLDAGVKVLKLKDEEDLLIMFIQP